MNRLLFALICIVLLAACGMPARGELLLVDPARRLNTEEVAAAASSLLERGVFVAIFVVEAGDESDFAQRLAAADLLKDEQIAAEGIAIYVSSTPRFSALRVGSRFSERLTSAQLDVIRAELLNPNLRADAFTAGVVGALTQIAAELAEPPVIVRWLTSLPPGVYGLIGLAAALLAGMWGVRRWQLEQYVRKIRADSYARSRAELDALAARTHSVLNKRRPVFELRERQTALAALERTLETYDAERAILAPDRDVRRSDAALVTQRAMRTMRSNYERLMLDIQNGARTLEEDAALNAALFDHVSGRQRLPINSAPTAATNRPATASTPTDYINPDDHRSSGGSESSSSGDW
jgi:uncharacterized membrane protein YgcG